VPFSRVCDSDEDGRSEADLGMFSMFGRTEAPQKEGPTKAQKNKYCACSSVHCSTGPQQNVDDDYCACRVKAVAELGVIHIV